jgi:hypothetical protein
LWLGGDAFEPGRPKFFENFTRQDVANPLQGREWRTRGDKQPGVAVQKKVKKSLVRPQGIQYPYPKPNQTHGETHDQNRV